jgi:hypothetical protein
MNYPSEEISDVTRKDLILMREEEKLAHDICVTLFARFGTQIFSNIAQSELTHTEAVHDLFTKYNIPDPVTTSDIGIFTVPKLTELYNDLTAQGGITCCWLTHWSIS